MNKKEDILKRLKEEKGRWEALLGNLSDEKIVAHDLPNHWSIKDVMAHLMAWQKATNARLDAALQNREPMLPEYAEHETDSEGTPDTSNAMIYDMYKDQPWSLIYSSWRDGFQRVLDSGAAVPEADLVDPKRYPWMDGYSLYDILQSSYEHHHIDHYEPLQAWLSRKSA